MTTKRFEHFLLSVAKVLELPSLAPDTEGACLVIIHEGNISLLFEFDEQLVPNTVLLSCAICPIFPENRAAILEATLIANEALEETLSMRPDEDVLYLHRRFYPETEAGILAPLIENFLETVKNWREKAPGIPSRQSGIPSPRGVEIPPYKA